ncbi:MAG: sulfate adenylyltransferase subunit CysD [Betaproteobacteria bacterium]|nr:sulfate adenylyltransferase subunit CysD [Betaproteobacteria bacterium]
MNAPDLLGLDTCEAWNTERAFQHLKALGQAATKRTAERRLNELGFFAPELQADALRDETGRQPTPSVLQWALSQARSQRKLVLFTQLHALPNGRPCLHANDARGGRLWVPLEGPATAERLVQALTQLQQLAGKDLVLFPHGELTHWARTVPPVEGTQWALLGYPPVLAPFSEKNSKRLPLTPHLKRLEAESIFILREAVAEAENPAMLYSIGKDSSVMLHLARKAFYPAPPPFPLLHVDTRWKFQEMILFRDFIARHLGLDLLVHVNPEAIARNINPFDHGSALHTDITKTEGLKQALDHYRFDMVFGGARRDEEKSRAKERVFSFRSPTHRWDPKAQRPELWALYNTKKSPGESIRVFPLSNWTELDVWQYIHHEQIPVVPLYFAKKRPVVERDGLLLMVDDERFRLLPGEAIQEKTVRFRTLGCYPLSGAIESNATTVPDIILELLNAHSSERQGRAIDHDSSASMEKKKQEGYF